VFRCDECLFVFKALVDDNYYCKNVEGTFAKAIPDVTTHPHWCRLLENEAKKEEEDDKG